MGDARSEEAWGSEEAGEIDRGAEPVDEGAAAIAISAGWSEVAGPSIKEEPEGL